MTTFNMPFDHVRNLSIIPEALKRTRILVVGCGTTGSWVAHDLLRMGFDSITVQDGDIVLPHNLPSQLHSPNNRRKKVESFAKVCRDLGMTPPRIIAKYVKPKDKLTGYDFVFSCVDNHGARKQIVEALPKETPLIDLRMSWESAAVLFSPPIPRKDYLASLKVETPEDTACGVGAVLSTAHSIVGVALGHWIAFHRQTRSPFLPGGTRERAYYWRSIKGAKRLKQRIRIDNRLGMTFEESEIREPKTTRSAKETTQKKETKTRKKPAKAPARTTTRKKATASRTTTRRLKKGA